MASDDPTRTVVTRKAWISEINRRFNKLKGDINQFILHSNRRDEDLIINQTFDFSSNPRAVLEFLVWLQTRIDPRIFDNEISAGIAVDAFWENKYINKSYERGVRIAQADLRRSGISLGATIADIQPAVIAGTAIPSLGFGVGAAQFLNQPIHLDAIQLLYTRDYSQLKGVTDVMSSQIARILVDGIEKGFGVREIAKNINNRVDKIGKVRAKLIARTETVRAYNIGVINEGESLAAQFGLDIRYRWEDSDDSRVRPTHVTRDGKIFTAERARELIGEPNCRCSLTAVIIDEDGKVIG